MESQPQNPEFRNNPEIFHQCLIQVYDSTLKYISNLSSIRQNLSNLLYPVRLQDLAKLNINRPCPILPLILGKN